MVFNFGKYKGRECDNLQYLAWVFGNVERQDIDYQQLAMEICDQQVEYFGSIEFSSKIMLMDRAFFWEKFKELWEAFGFNEPRGYDNPNWD